MSIETWKKEFYPVSAKEFVDGEVRPSEIVAHSLRKWEGLSAYSLDKHALNKAGAYIYDGCQVIDQGGSSCSLCQAFYREHSCVGCPLYEMLDRNCDSEYQAWVHTGDTRPMIYVIQRTYDMVSAKEK